MLVPSSSQVDPYETSLNYERRMEYPALRFIQLADVDRPDYGWYLLVAT
jgi:hypothetical protein